MSEEENTIKEKLEELREYLEYGLDYKDYINVVNAFDYIEKILEKQQAEIEKYKMLLAETNVQFLNSDLKTKRKNEEDLEMLNAGWKQEIEIKDKIIEEMAKYIGDLDIDEDICKKKIDDCYVDIYDDKACKDCVKEYFKNKVKEKKNEEN